MKKVFFVWMLVLLAVLSGTAWADKVNVKYLDENGALLTSNDVKLLLNTMEPLSTDWYLVSGTVTFPNRITVSRDVHLILADGARLGA